MCFSTSFCGARFLTSDQTKLQYKSKDQTVFSVWYSCHIQATLGVAAPACLIVASCPISHVVLEVFNATLTVTTFHELWEEFLGARKWDSWLHNWGSDHCRMVKHLHVFLCGCTSPTLESPDWRRRYVCHWQEVYSEIAECYFMFCAARFALMVTWLCSSWGRQVDLTKSLMIYNRIHYMINPAL